MASAFVIARQSAFDCTASTFDVSRTGGPQSHVGVPIPNGDPGVPNFLLPEHLQGFQPGARSDHIRGTFRGRLNATIIIVSTGNRMN